MAKPITHAELSAKRFGGKFEDYLPIHDFMDSSKSVFCDNRHRALTHNSWFLSNVIERVFGHVIVNSAGKKVSTREIAEWHVYEDFGMKYIPAASDYLQLIEPTSWINNGKGDPPPSAAKLVNQKRDVKTIKIISFTKD